MSALDHSDALLAIAAGKWVMACDTVHGVNMTEGGRLHYAPGARFRVKHSIGDILWCLDESGRTVSFDRVEMAGLERTP